MIVKRKEMWTMSQIIQQSEHLFILVVVQLISWTDFFKMLPVWRIYASMGSSNV